MLTLVRQGYQVAAINPTCSLTMRKEYPAALLAGAEAKEFAGPWWIHTRCSDS
jgi:hypothetical protein